VRAKLLGVAAAISAEGDAEGRSPKRPARECIDDQTLSPAPLANYARRKR